MAEECSICFRARDGMQLACGHTFCAHCVSEWSRRSTTCPACRATMVPKPLGIHTYPRSPLSVLRWLPLSVPHSHAGVTVENGSSGGSRVVRVRRGDAAHASGLQPGDVIDSINGVACVDHGHTVRMLDEATRHRIDVICSVTPSKHAPRRRRAPKPSLFPWMTRRRRESRRVTYAPVNV